MSKEQPHELTGKAPLGDFVAGTSSKWTTRKASSATSKKNAASDSKGKVAAKTDAQSSLEKARRAVEAFAEVNADQAYELGVQLADAEAAFPLAMMSAYQERKAEHQAGGLDTATFLDGLTEQVTALKETSVTITLPAASRGALPEGADAEA